MPCICGPDISSKGAVYVNDRSEVNIPCKKARVSYEQQTEFEGTCKINLHEDGESYRKIATGTRFNKGSLTQTCTFWHVLIKIQVGIDLSLSDIYLHKCVAGGLRILLFRALCSGFVQFEIGENTLDIQQHVQIITCDIRLV
ncbi:hypothetical protein TNCV_4221781 [Trichonephila clavipes]|nr:hypothetical protein TNCV_4221781 [Trichonephila clavipes]